MIETQEATIILEGQPEKIIVPVKEFNGIKIITPSNYTITLAEKYISFNSDKIVLEESDEDTKETNQRKVHHCYWHLKERVYGVDYYWTDIDKCYNLAIRLNGVSNDWYIGCESLSHAKKIAEQIRQWLIK